MTAEQILRRIRQLAKGATEIELAKFAGDVHYAGYLEGLRKGRKSARDDLHFKFTTGERNVTTH